MGTTRSLVGLIAVVLSDVNGGTISAGCTDADGDGFFVESGCGTPLDCNDGASGTFPGAPEFCDGLDNDCDQQVDNSQSCNPSCDLPEAVMCRNSIVGFLTRSRVTLGRSSKRTLRCGRRPR